MKYRLATNPADYRKVKALWREFGVDEGTASFPTVMAENEDGLQGFIATHTQNGMIIAGPMVFRRQGLATGLAMDKLVEAYERILKQAGLSRYSFCVAPETLDRMRDFLAGYGFEFWTEHDGHYWYNRNLKAA